MRDTSPEVERRYREMLLSRSGEERLKMGCSMFGMARALFRASILAKNPDATAGELRRAIFLRWYGREFDAETKQKILSALGKAVFPSAAETKR